MARYMVTLQFKFVRTNDINTGPDPTKEEIDIFMNEDYLGVKRHKELMEATLFPCRALDITYNGGGRISCFVDKPAVSILSFALTKDFVDWIMNTSFDESHYESNLAVYYSPNGGPHDVELGIFDCRFKDCIFVTKI